MIPEGLFVADPWWRNMFENALTVQFNHRVMAYVITVVVAGYAYVVQSRAGFILLAAVSLQVALGIWTLLWAVPLWLGLAHQGGALLVLAAAIWNLHTVLASKGRHAPFRAAQA